MTASSAEIKSTYIGRANRQYNLKQSPLANPYLINFGSERKQVIQLYRQWLWNQIQADNDVVVANLFLLFDRVNEGQETILTCWCHPKPCHGDVIIRCIKWMISQGY